MVGFRRSACGRYDQLNVVASPEDQQSPAQIIHGKTLIGGSRNFTNLTPDAFSANKWTRRWAKTGGFIYHFHFVPGYARLP